MSNSDLVAELEASEDALYAAECVVRDLLDELEYARRQIKEAIKAMVEENE